ncbi:MAG: hypothetical protein JXB88_05170 [Spirochaetales bacterium]|nr:hypothetical protein [Spirochaetales bacterium]
MSENFYSDIKSLLPGDIIDKSVCIGYNKYGWKLHDVQSVVTAYEHIKIAALGGSVKCVFSQEEVFILIDIYTETGKKNQNESWDSFVHRSCNDFMSMFNDVILKLDLKKEALEIESIKAKIENGLDIDDYLYVFITPVSETTHNVFTSLY